MAWFDTSQAQVRIRCQSIWAIRTYELTRHPSHYYGLDLDSHRCYHKHVVSRVWIARVSHGSVCLWSVHNTKKLTREQEPLLLLLWAGCAADSQFMQHCSS